MAIYAENVQTGLSATQRTDVVWQLRSAQQARDWANGRKGAAELLMCACRTSTSESFGPRSG